MHQFAESQAIMSARWLPWFATLVALAFGLLIWSEEADARLDAGLSFAGESIYTAIGWDAFDSSTVPTAAQPSYPGGSLGGLFNRGGLIGGFAAGFLGSGVIGFLFGHGVIGELSGVASVLGLLLQLALIVMLVRLIWTWWHDNKVDAIGNLSPRQLADAYGHSRNEALPDIDRGAQPEAALGENHKDALTTKRPHA